MKTYIVTQTDAEAQPLQGALPLEVVNEAVFVPSGNRSAVISMARSLIVRRRTPVVVVLDADTTSPRLIREQHREVEEIIGMVAAHVPFKVILAVPTLAEELASASQPSEAPAVRALAEFLRQAPEAATPALSLAGSA